MFALIKWLVFVPLFNAQKVLNYFVLEMAAIIVVRRNTEMRECVVEGWKYRFPSHVIFNLLQEIKEDLEPSTRSHVIPGLSKLLATSSMFWPPVLFNLPWLIFFLYSLFATALIYSALGILRWLICKWDVASVFFNLHVVSKSPVEISPPIRPGADLGNWWPQGNIGKGPYTFAHIYLDQPWGSFFVVILAAAQWRWVQCLYIFHVHVIMCIYIYSFIRHFYYFMF